MNFYFILNLDTVTLSQKAKSARTVKLCLQHRSLTSFILSYFVFHAEFRDTRASVQQMLAVSFCLIVAYSWKNP
jgi:hypothetical protein